MHVHDALRTRRTIHRYRPDPVPGDVVRRALEAAILAPNHRLTQPWRFVLLGRDSRRPLADRNVALKTAGDGAPLSPEACDRIRGKILDPPGCLVVGCVRSDDPLRWMEDREAVACAVQNVCLSLHGDGVGSKWSSGGITRHADAYAAAGLDPDDVEIVGFVWMGYAAETPAAPARSPLDEVYREAP